jgi:uncharacterized OB-fold protein
MKTIAAASEHDQSARTGNPSLLAGQSVEWDADNNPVLIGGRCRTCRAVTFPCSPVCTHCMSDDIAPEAMPRMGKLYTFTTLHVGPQRWVRPAVLGYVDLPNGVRVFSRIAGDTDRLKIDDLVELDVAVVGQEQDGTPISNIVFKRAEQTR